MRPKRTLNHIVDCRLNTMDGPRSRAGCKKVGVNSEKGRALVSLHVTENKLDANLYLSSPGSAVTIARETFENLEDGLHTCDEI